MKKHLLKRVLIILAALSGLLIAGALVVPLVIPVAPLEGLVSVAEVQSTESRFVTLPFEGTDGIEINYIEKSAEALPAGEDAPVFILLHGSMFNAYTWDGVMGDLAGLGRVLAYDQIPYGLSEKLVEGDWNGPNPYTQEAAIDQLFAFMDAREVENAVLVGNSYGGTLAVRAALENPGRIEGLILEDAAVFVNESMPGWLLDSPQMAKMGPLFARSLNTGEAFFEKCYLDPALFDEERRSLTQINTRVESWDTALWQYLKAWGAGAQDFTGRIGEITVPVLVIHGEEDEVVPPGDSDKLHELLPESTLVMIPDTGHLPHEETPQEFVAAVKEWLALMAE